jgi:hypothetical protein
MGRSWAQQWITARAGWSVARYPLGGWLSNPAATKRIRTGDRVRVDGDRGPADINPRNAPQEASRRLRLSASRRAYS